MQWSDEKELRMEWGLGTSFQGFGPLRKSVVASHFCMEIKTWQQ